MYIMKILRPLLLMFGYLNYVEHLSWKIDFKVVFCEVKQEVAKNPTLPWTCEYYWH